MDHSIEVESKNPIMEQIILEEINSRNVYIYGEINDDTEFIVSHAFDKIEKMDVFSTELKPITVHINSPGGSVFSSLSIISKIEEFKSKGYKVITDAHGLVASGAFFIFITGSERISQRHSRYMIHQPAALSVGFSSVENARRQSKEIEEIWERLRCIVKNYTYMNDEFLDHITNTDKDEFFWPEQGRDYGFIDIIT